MEIEFDPDKDATNLAKHKISLKRAADLVIEDFNRQVRNGERRLQVIGRLDGKIYTLIFVFRRNAVRAISLRRANEEELASMARKKKEGLSEDSVPFDHEDIVIDEDNPEWTDEVFARARPASELPPEILAFFPKTLAKLRGEQKAPKKVPVSLRLSPEVLEHFRSTGKGWQTRVDEALKAQIAETKKTG